VTDHHDDLRAFTENTAVHGPAGRSWQFHVIAFTSIEGIEADTKVLGGMLAVAAPLIVLVSLVAGYTLSRRALRPVQALGASISSMAPGDLAQRLPVDEPRDEIDVLAAEFNSLLERLGEAERRNRGFVREAAHQIRTPLTLVLGEAEHALAVPREPAELAAALGRVRVAAEQMRRRVDELFLLAEAQAGEPVHLNEDVELEGLVLEATDLMRSRADSLGRALALGTVDHVTVRGNAHLLREAMLELLENACRHGDASAPVVTSVQVNGGRAQIAVHNAAAPDADASHHGAGHGLGLAIVRWIAASHGGALTHERAGRDEAYTIDLPKLG
jgi:signal transduction histidine kinase